MKHSFLALSLFAALLAGCASATDPSVILKTPFTCDEIVSKPAANQVLGRAQIVRVKARDMVAALYPTVLDENAVRNYDANIDRPFTEFYVKARHFVEVGQYEWLRQNCVEFQGLVDAMLPFAKLGEAK